MSHDLSAIDFDEQQKLFTTIVNEPNKRPNERQRQSFIVITNGPKPIILAEHTRLITFNSFDILEMKLTSKSSYGSLTNANGSEDNNFSFTNTNQPTQLFDEETTKKEDTKAIKDYYYTMEVFKDNVSQNILQHEKAYSIEQKCALNDVVNKHTEGTAH